jgi:hypothetical protein
MSDHDPGEAVSPAEPQAVEEIHAMPDPILVAMAATAAQDESFEMGLTLHVSGVVVSGIMVSPSRFFEQLALWLTERGAADFAQTFAVPVAEMFHESAANDEQDAPSIVSFIHLQDARVFTSGTNRPLPEVLWRGRLSHVSAWSIGAMGASET